MISQEGRKDVEKDLKREGAKVGIRRVAGDPSKPERPDNVAQLVARRAGRVVDPEDRFTIGIFIAWLVMLILVFSALGLAIRLFLYLAGFREALF